MAHVWASSPSPTIRSSTPPATDNGIAYVDWRRELPAWLAQTLTDPRASCDAVIAFPHWGPNMAPEPQRWQPRRAAELQAAGAQLVAGHSAHVFHGVAWGTSGPILTDLGGALDDYRVDSELRNDLGLSRSGAQATPQLSLNSSGFACALRSPTSPAASTPTGSPSTSCWRAGLYRSSASPSSASASHPDDPSATAASGGIARQTLLVELHGNAQLATTAARLPVDKLGSPERRRALDHVPVLIKRHSDSARPG